MPERPPHDNEHFASTRDERRAVDVALELIDFRKKWPDTTPTRGVQVSDGSVHYEIDQHGMTLARKDSSSSELPEVIGIRTSEPRDIGIG